MEVKVVLNPLEAEAYLFWKTAVLLRQFLNPVPERRVAILKHRLGDLDIRCEIAMPRATPRGPGLIEELCDEADLLSEMTDHIPLRSRCRELLEMANDAGVKRVAR